MKRLVDYTINVKGQLIDLSEPQIMAILNITPDSFYADSRKQSEDEIRSRVEEIVREGGSMIDIGAFSTRPGAEDVSREEEVERLRKGMKILRDVAPQIPVSVDTFRADVAKMAVEELGADIVNDISGGQLDKEMFPTVARLKVPYILTHYRQFPPDVEPHYDDLIKDVLLYFAEKIQLLRDLGQKDIILDPGFGFGKTLDQNFQLVCHLEELKIFELPILSGVSRKSMIYKALDKTPSDVLNGTTMLNSITLFKGANILRVHDVMPAVEVVKLARWTQNMDQW